MARRRTVRLDEAAEVLTEAQRILQQRDAAALADDFDETYTAEVAATLLAPAAWRTLKNYLAQRRSNQRTMKEGTAPARARLPAEIAPSARGVVLPRSPRAPGLRPNQEIFNRLIFARQAQQVGGTGTDGTAGW